jgi:thioredoxin-related protein
MNCKKALNYRMLRKKITLLIIFGFMAVSAAAQDSLPVYKRFPTLPPFKIIKVPDSIVYKKEDLKKKKATIIIVFSPDCDHCQHAAKDLMANSVLFKKTQIIMAAYPPYISILKFYNEYGIAAHANIVMGMDAGYFFSSFYSVRSFPSIFIYDKKGNFVKRFEGSVSFAEIAKAL